MIAHLFIAESSAELNDPPQGWMWLKPSTGEIFEFNDGLGWVLKATVSLASHGHPTLEDINFLGDISVDGDEGITGEFEGTFKKIVIKNGIITEFELE